MVTVLMLCLLASLSIYIGLILFENVLLTFILFHGLVCCLIPIIDLTLVQKSGFKGYLTFIGFRHFQKISLPAILTGIGFGLTILVFFISLQDIFLNVDEIQSLFQRWGVNNDYIIPFMLMMIVGNSIFEEIYWRGYIYGKLESVASSFQVLILSSVFYASYHLMTTSHIFSILHGIVFTCIIFCVGLFWGIMRRKYDSLYFSMISHLLADLGIMLIYLKYFGSV